MKLVLFDVDGVLLPVGSVKLDYWKEVSRKHFGVGVERETVYMHGKTDRQILFELLQHAGIKDPEEDARFEAALEDIGKIVSEHTKGKKINPIAGVEELLKHLSREKHVLGLLTGNTREKCHAKLQAAGLWHYFKCGGFGDATRKRSELVPIAIEDARKKTGINFKKKDVWLVGDTERDILCAKEASVRIVAVATGTEGLEQLGKEKPDYLFNDFRDVKKIIAAISA
jgi:phosphoglycolate phosphatase-like HAD superfamily hydrolase